MDIETRVGRETVSRAYIASRAGVFRVPHGGTLREIFIPAGSSKEVARNNTESHVLSIAFVLVNGSGPLLFSKNADISMPFASVTAPPDRRNFLLLPGEILYAGNSPFTTFSTAVVETF